MSVEISSLPSGESGMDPVSECAGDNDGFDSSLLGGDVLPPYSEQEPADDDCV